MRSADFKKAYFGTALGYLWSLARPLMLFGVLLAVFTQVFRIGSEVPNYPVLLLFNIVLFGFFQEATITAVTSIVSQESVVRKTQFPRLVIPLAVVLTTLFNLGLNLVVVFVFILAWGIDPTWTWLLFPLVAGAALRAHHRRLDDRLVAVSALPRHGDHLVRGGHGALLRLARALSGGEACRPRSATSSSSTPSPRCSSWRACG